MKQIINRIISVQCMLTSLKTNKKLPRSPSPIYSFSFDNLNVCCTNIEKKQRVRISKFLVTRAEMCYCFLKKINCQVHYQRFQLFPIQYQLKQLVKKQLIFNYEDE